jgi:hypothetical protein
LLKNYLTPSAYQSLQHEKIERLKQKTVGGDIYTSPDGIVRYVREILRADPTPYQKDILRALVEKKRVAVRGPHGLGKTTIAAWVVLWAITSFDTDVKVPTTASAWRQLTFYLWPEVRKWAAKADWKQLGLNVRRGKELLDLSLKLPDKEAFAVASDNAALIEGAHATTLVYVFDEAKAIPNDTWDAAEGAFSAGNCYALAISTPGEPSGRFYDIHARKPGFEDWYTRHVTVDEAIAAGRISQEWVDQRARQWGKKSAVFQNRVLGEFDASGEDNVIPLAWVELANKRFYECDGKGSGETTYGVDVARYGEDQTAIARLVGRVLEAIEYHAKQSTMQTAGRVAAIVPKTAATGVDVIGVGAGVYDRLQEQKFAVRAVNVSEKTDIKTADGKQGFYNLRSALWWIAREALDPENPDAIALPPDDRLTGDLTAPLWTYTSDGKIRVESKDDIRARIGRSTDAGDAFMLALYVATHRIGGAAAVDWW